VFNSSFDHLKAKKLKILSSVICKFSLKYIFNKSVFYLELAYAVIQI